MTKPDWKTKPHERKRMTLQQENAELKRRIENVQYELEDVARSAKHFRDLADRNHEAAARYEVLRTKDVMVLDGEPKYLKGEDLDAYCDVEKEKFWGLSLTGMINSAAKFRLNPTKMYVPSSMVEQAEKILKENNNGSNSRESCKEADQKDSGHHTDILRYADWYGLWKQRRT